MARLGTYHTGGHGRIGVYKVNRGGGPIQCYEILILTHNVLIFKTCKKTILIVNNEYDDS